MMTTLHSYLNTRQHLEDLSVKMTISNTRKMLNSEFTDMFSVTCTQKKKYKLIWYESNDILFYIFRST